MVLRRVVAVVLALVSLGPLALEAKPAPKVVSIYPLGGQQGKALEVEVQGSGLEGSYAIWLGAGSRLEDPKSPNNPRGDVKYSRGPDGIRAHVKEIQHGSRARVRLTIAPDARVGLHSLGLISPSGLSGTIYVADRMISMGDVYATLYKAFGIDWTKTYITSIGRPIYIANALGDKQGEPIKELI